LYTQIELSPREDTQTRTKWHPSTAAGTVAEPNLNPETHPTTSTGLLKKYLYGKDCDVEWKHTQIWFSITQFEAEFLVVKHILQVLLIPKS
jgi:hypothetical protein